MVLPITSSFLIRFRPVKYQIEAFDVFYPMVRWSCQILLLVRSRPWSNLVNFGQTSPNLDKCAPGHVLRVLKCNQTPLGSNWLSLGHLVLAVDTRENPGGKNRIMTNVIIGRPTLNKLRVVTSIYHFSSVSLWNMA